MGAHETVDPAQGSPFDTVKPAVVFEAVGVPGIINDVFRRAPAGSRLVVAGVCMEPDTVLPFFGTAKEINVQFVLAYDAAEFAESLRAIAEGDIDVGPLITGEVGLDGVGAAFDDAGKAGHALQDPGDAVTVWCQACRSQRERSCRPDSSSSPRRGWPPSDCRRATRRRARR